MQELNLKVKCKCTHSLGTHADKGRCCAVWQLKNIEENKDLPSLLRFCECMKFENDMSIGGVV